MSSPVARGAGCLVEGVGLITRPGLRRYVVVPLLINILVFTGAIAWGVSAFDGLMARMEAAVPHWLGWLEWVLWPVFVLALLVIVFYGFSLVANLIAAPFNGLLAEKTEALLTGRAPDDSIDWKRLLRELPGTLIDEVRKIAYALLWSLPFLVLAFALPLVGPVLWFLFTAWMLTLQYTDYPMGNNGLKFRAERATLHRRRAVGLGFGAAVSLLTMVPVANFIAMPAAVAGATALWVRELRAAAA